MKNKWSYLLIKPSHLIFLLLICSLPILRPVRTTIVSPHEVALLKVFFALMLGGLAWIQSGLSRQKCSLPIWVVGFLVTWVAVIFPSILLSENFYSTVQYLFMFLGGVAFFWFSATVSKPVFRWGVMLTVALAMGVVTVGLCQYSMLFLQHIPKIIAFLVPAGIEYFLVEPSSHLQSHFFRVSGTMLHPNHLGIYSALIAPFAAALASVKGFGKAWRFAYGVIFIFCLAGLFVSNSRSGFLACLTALSFLVLFREFRWMAFIGLLTGAIVFVVAVYDSELSSTFILKWLRTGDGLSYREVIWRNALELIKGAPWFGYGPGEAPFQYVSNYGFFVVNDISQLKDQMRFLWSGGELLPMFHLHNIYLQIVVEEGVIPVLLYLGGLVILIFYGVRKSRFQRRGSWSRVMALSMTASVIGFMVYGFFDSQIIFTRFSLNLCFAPLLAAGLRV